VNTASISTNPFHPVIEQNLSATSSANYQKDINTNSPTFIRNNPHLLPPLFDYDKGRIATPPEAGELFVNGTSNIINKNWLAQIEIALGKNGGTGDQNEGFLAWGINGFFRFKNDSLPPELNQRYATASLVTGLPIEQLKITNSYSEKDLAGKTEFIDKFETGLKAFFADPKAGFSVDGGGVKFEAYIEPQSGAVAFYRRKKKSWLNKIVNKASKILKPIGQISKFIPGAGTVIATISKGVQMVSDYLDQRYAQSAV